MSELKLGALEYSHINTISRHSQEEDFEDVEISNYINDIEERTERYKQTEYLKNITQIGSQVTFEIPEEQRIFSHYIDKENSENLDLLDGISESDFESFETLQLTLKNGADGEKVKIAFKKNFYGAAQVEYSGSGMNSNQYRHVVGMSDKYIKTEEISLKNVATKEINVKKIWKDNDNQQELRPESIQV